MKLAAIDIGSNAARLLIVNVQTDTEGNTDYTKLNLIRIPLRLGFDVFSSGKISTAKTEQLIDTMRIFSLLMKVYEVEHFSAFATSAMRDASNGIAITKKIKKETNLSITVISGSEEAEIIYETHIAELLDKKDAYLYIDVGGGSTEVTLYAKGKLITKRSFNIGTIRLLNNLINANQWKQLSDFISKHTKQFPSIKAIGSGGNINKLFSLTKQKEGTALSFTNLQKYYKEFSKLSVTERMQHYRIREDRADVIVPAMEVYLSIMKAAKAKEIFVPRIGLADGMIKKIYSNLEKKKNKVKMKK